MAIAASGPLSNGSIHYMHKKSAFIFSEFFKFQEFKLDFKMRILHFEGPRDFLVLTKLMDYPVEAVFVSFRVCCFKRITSMLFIFKLQHFGAHPLFYYF